MMVFFSTKKPDFPWLFKVSRIPMAAASDSSKDTWRSISWCDASSILPLNFPKSLTNNWGLTLFLLLFLDTREEMEKVMTTSCAV